MSKLYSEVYGEGKTLVMLHGWAMHCGVWREFARSLATEFRVVCLDLPGHGRSRQSKALTLVEMAHEIAAQVDEPVAGWLGWSLGGLVATEIAQQFPERVAALILIASNPRFMRDDQWPGMRTEVLQSFMQNLALDPQTTLLRFLTLQCRDLDNNNRILATLRAAVAECTAPTREVLSAGLQVLQQSDLRIAVGAISIPILALLGAKDALVPVTLADALSNLGVSCQVVAKAGHAPFLSHPDDCLQSIAHFMRSL